MSLHLQLGPPKQGGGGLPHPPKVLGGAAPSVASLSAPSQNKMLQSLFFLLKNYKLYIQIKLHISNSNFY